MTQTRVFSFTLVLRWECVYASVLTIYQTFIALSVVCWFQTPWWIRPIKSFSRTPEQNNRWNKWNRIQQKHSTLRNEACVHSFIHWLVESKRKSQAAQIRVQTYMRRCDCDSDAQRHSHSNTKKGTLDSRSLRENICECKKRLTDGRVNKTLESFRNFVFLLMLFIRTISDRLSKQTCCGDGNPFLTHKKTKTIMLW